MPQPTPTADPAQTRAELENLRPDLVERYDAALPGARAAILRRLRLAIEREPLPGAVYADMDPVELTAKLWPGTPFVTEVANSVANLALARANAVRPSLTETDLGRIEQFETDGHPLHPGCRTRAGMTVADVLAYAPEHRPVIRLRRLRVPAERWHGAAQPVLYAHPWQAARLREQYPWLTDAGPTRPMRPLMSLRTVAPVSGGPHLKTAVDVQMTSAVRTVSPAAVHNGPILSAALQRLTADLPIDILAETEAGAVITEHGPDRRLAHLVRRAPRLAPGEQAVPLGIFTNHFLSTVDDPYAWLAQLTDLLFTPLATVLTRGVALEAHGQNTLVVLRDRRPVRILYRDLGGVRVSRELGLDLHGDLLTDDPATLRTKLAAAALGTVAGQLVDAFAAHHGAEPDRLWAIVAAGLRQVPELLTEPLPIKATTAMRLAADPLDDIWTFQPNPMAVHA